MERNVDVATGESVAFSYELAGLGSRFLALFVDLSIQIGVVIAVTLLLVWISSGAPDTGKSVGHVSKIADAIVDSIFVISGFLLFFGYFILFEWRFNGRTPGKRLLGIRVIRDGGFPVDFTASVVRNVVRIVEMAFAFYTVSAIIMLFSPLNRRIGDLAAGTLVVRDNKYERTAPRSFRPESEHDDAIARELTASQRELILRYVERRNGLSLAARTQVSAQIAATVRPKLAASFDHIDDDHLLVHLATTALS